MGEVCFLVIMLLISGHGRDWRSAQTKAYTLDCPDESLASLSRMNTLMSFEWNSPVAPQKTFILMNDLPLDEQLISSLPETPSVRFRVKKDAGASVSESGVIDSNTAVENKSVESPQQVVYCHCCIYCTKYTRFCQHESYTYNVNTAYHHHYFSSMY